ncbi:FAD-binding and (Fe-S)-binding domain-containing protein [Natrarchaeobius oligotrophus]|uniref:D-lactate dehydrogenase (cytochrome) n=1 Tax=Natrarchaeobius chitinivorans TaxID=1679083 RepID=A0A3N6MBT2_NATCH|nr:FAD-binding and (Fe-S)-binding domain-containing protein [Natrarchaeobius chitinivorans]RQH00068.1 FAD-binding oxidoreductase [Natrarchaeobius chitinivorans]
MAVEDDPATGTTLDHAWRTSDAETAPTDRASLKDALEEACRGEVRFDEYARVLYATDGSIYGAQPAGVVVPRDEDDVRAAVAVAADHDAPVLPRGAGSSLAGQAVGPGCVVLDLSRHVDEILEVDPDAKTAVVQPGVVQDDLDAALEPHGLKFAPDPASSNRATIGGGIGNNSTGAHSVRYGITDAYVDECRVVLADGSVIRTRDVVIDGDEWNRIVAKDDLEAEIYRTVRAVVEENRVEIETRYPDLERCVSGYNLQKVIRTADGETTDDLTDDQTDLADGSDAEGERIINLSKLLVGAEGTLGVVTEATLSLVTRPEETALLLCWYDDLVEALAAVPEALALEPSAVELMDDEVFRLAADSPEYAEYVAPIPDDAAATLMLEFDSEVFDDLPAAVSEASGKLVERGSAFGALEAFSVEDQARLWKLRKAAIPLLMSMEGDPKPYPFVEDASVPPDELAEYVVGFEEILRDHETTAAYFAHAGAGTLHIRPVLNLKEDDGVETMRSIAEDVTSLALEHGGAFSGEHGDGLARTEFNPRLYGPDLWAAFKEVKSAFDPDWLLNPGKVVYRDDDPTEMTDHLRYGADYASLEPRTALDFDDDGGFSHLVELCNGCGTCRRTDGDVMCPTYRATGEEIATTRGRANLLRAAISGEIDSEELYSDRFHEEVLDLCIGCKGCQSDCPTGVDLAKLKAELKRQRLEREGASLRERLFANVDRLASLASAAAPLSNLAPALPGSRTVLDRIVGIAPERTLPAFQRESLVSWFDDRGPAVARERATDRVVLYPDTYANYSDSSPGRAAVAVLEAAGVHVAVADLGPTGRAAYSQGMLGTATERGLALLEDLERYVDRGWSVVFVEPSDSSMVVDEYRSLLSGEVADARLEALAANTYDVCEFLDRRRLDERIEFDVGDAGPLVYHGHCHQKARGTDHHPVAVLRRAGYAVEPVDSGCCGMAGSFGYEREHYDLSRSIGELLRGQLEDAFGHASSSPRDAAPSGFETSDRNRSAVVAPGVSCRTQVGDFDGYDRPDHPIEALARALETDSGGDENVGDGRATGRRTRGGDAGTPQKRTI